MEYDFVRSVLTLLKESKNFYFLLYAAATCLLTQIVKKLFVDKIKTEIFGKFNPAEILPFFFGAVFSAVNGLFVEKVTEWNFDAIYGAVTEAIAIGATATVLFKTVTSLSGNSLRTLLKDDVFQCLFTQLTYFPSVREQLTSGQLQLCDLIDRVRTVSDRVKAIYAAEETEEDKKAQIAHVLSGIFPTEDAALLTETVLPALKAHAESRQG